MNKKGIAVFSAIALVAVVAVVVILLQGVSDLDRVMAATEDFRDVGVAEAQGYINVNVDECVESPEGAMGYHFLNQDILDLALDPENPEILVYAPESDGGYRLVAVEYAVPIEPWDAQNDAPPTVLDQELHPNPVLGLYVLHAWIYEDNPAGIYSDWNPNLSCQS